MHFCKRNGINDEVVSIKIEMDTDKSEQEGQGLFRQGQSIKYRSWARVKINWRNMNDHKK